MAYGSHLHTNTHSVPGQIYIQNDANGLRFVSTNGRRVQGGTIEVRCLQILECCFLVGVHETRSNQGCSELKSVQQSKCALQHQPQHVRHECLQFPEYLESFFWGEGWGGIRRVHMLAFRVV